MTTHKPIVVIGSLNIDLVATTTRIPAPGETIAGRDFHIHPGGKGANQAVAIARLGYPVHMIGRIGDDLFGSQLRTSLDQAGVGHAAVMVSPGTSGVAVIVVASTGENSIVITPGANGLLTPSDLDAHIDLLRSAGLVLAQLEIPIRTLEHLAKLCAREGLPLILDPAPAAPLPDTIFRSIAWITPNETEAAFYNPSADANAPAATAQAFLERGVSGIVLKQGARGAYLATADGLRTAIAPFHVTPVDTTAAGDAFNGAFATALMLGRSPAESARFASAAAALSVTRAGAQSSMPNMDQVLALLQSSQATTNDQLS